MAQIGGSLMEIQITNPSTFQIDRRELLNVINQIDLDITLHGDPNIGFTAAYATRAQGGAGYNIVHRYMKRYIEQMASFKYEIDHREDLDFEMGYVNMHASTNTIPALEERMASDVSVDPFGEQMRDISEEENDKQYNIYRNEEFLENLFDYLFLDKVDQPWRVYERVFVNYSDDFRSGWNDAKEEVSNRMFDSLSEDEKINLLESVANAQGIETAFLDKRDKERLSNIGVKVRRVVGQDEQGNPQYAEDTINFSSISDFSNKLGLFQQVRAIARDLYNLENGNFALRGQQAEITDKGRKTLQNSISQVRKGLIDVLEELWDEDVSIDSKENALIRSTEIQQGKISQEAQDIGEDAAREAFAHEDWEVRKKILNNLAQGQLREELNKESGLFFHTIPAWIQACDKDYGEMHPGWEAPKFIWDAIIDRDFEDYEEYRSWLYESRENQLDMIAVVGAVYLWGHYTQVEDDFDRQAFESDTAPNIDKPQLKNGIQGRYTWSEWMNKFGLKVNIEAMYGDPGQILRVWRPKDIAVVCHAINKTAKKQSEEWSEDYKGPIAKFTIDMEHTASFGVDPYQEIKQLIEQEKQIADQTEADTEKPLAEIMKTYHLTKPGWEQQQGHRHGPFARGDETLYKWLYKMVENGFCRNPDDRGVVMFEVGGEYREEMYVIRVAMDMIAKGITPEDLDPNEVPLEGNYENPRQALMARFFGLDKPQFNSEWTKIEEHAFDPLEGLLEAESFDFTWTSRAAVENDNRPAEWMQEEYR
jgi:hypothetical protein